MAPTKKRGAPAQPSKPVRRRKPSTPEREAKLTAWQDKQKAISQDARRLIIDLAPPIIPDLSKPKKWTEQMEAVFLQLVTLGMPVLEISKREDMPSEYLLWTHIGDSDHKISHLYAQGKQLRVAKLEEEIENIARTPVVGAIIIETMKSDEGSLVPVTETRSFDAIEHRRLLVDTLKWTLAHTRPKKHGRQPEASGDGKNDQLESLFSSLKGGPAKANEDLE
jgi:hypothetical protein